MTFHLYVICSSIHAGFLLVLLQVFVCLWKGCKVYNTPSTSQSWLQRHMLTHSGDKPFKVSTGAWVNAHLFLGSLLSAQACLRDSLWSRVKAFREVTCDAGDIFDVRIVCCRVVLQCVVGGCNASFASQGGLARHVPSHFSQQNSSKLSSQAKLKEESPSKAGLNKRKKLKNKRRCSLRTYLCYTQTKHLFRHWNHFPDRFMLSFC